MCVCVCVCVCVYIYIYIYVYIYIYIYLGDPKLRNFKIRNALNLKTLSTAFMRHVNFVCRKGFCLPAVYRSCIWVDPFFFIVQR